MRLQQLDFYKQVVEQGYDVMLYPETLFSRDVYKPELIKAEGINGNKLSSYKSNPYGEAVITEKDVNADRHNLFENMYLDSRDNDVLFKLTDIRGNTTITSVVSIADIIRGTEDAFGNIDNISLVINIKEIL